MDEIALYKILALDSIYHVLRWEDRIDIRYYLQGRFDAEDFSEKVRRAADWVQNWTPPRVAYQKDKVLEAGFSVWYQGEMISLEEYRDRAGTDHELEQLILK